MPNPIDMMDYEAGDLTVFELTFVNGVRMWKARCTCGAIVTATAVRIRTRLRSCPRCSAARSAQIQKGTTRESVRLRTEATYKAMEGRIFGDYLEVLKVYREGIFFIADCKCACGKLFTRRCNQILNDRTVYQSCGCKKYQLQKELKDLKLTHRVLMQEEAQAQEFPYKNAETDLSKPAWSE